MRCGWLLVAPTLILTTVIVLICGLFFAHTVLRYLNPDGNGIAWLTYIAQQDWAPAATTVILVVTVVGWLATLLLDVAHREKPNSEQKEGTRHDAARAGSLSVPGTTPEGPQKAAFQAWITPRQSKFIDSGEALHNKGEGVPLLRVACDIRVNDEASIENIKLALSGEQYPSIRFQLIHVGPSIVTDSIPVTVYFTLPKNIAKGQHSANILAFIGDAWWTSNPFHFEVRPSTHDKEGSQP